MTMPAKPQQPDPVLNEIVNYQNPLLFLKVWEIESNDPYYEIPVRWRWHYHKEVEFLAVTEGRLGYQTSEEYDSLDSGELILFGSSQLHRVHKSHATQLKYVVLQIDLLQHFETSSMPYLTCFSELTEPLSRLNYIFREQLEVRKEAFTLVMDIYRETQQREKGYELAISSAVKRLMFLLLRCDTRSYLDSARDQDAIRLRPALDYIEQHLHEKITVEDICRILNLSYHYFIRYFHQVMGVSFVEYVNYQRIKKAERLLLTRDLSCQEVGLEVGIPSAGLFYKLFKRLNHCTPMQFRKKMKREMPAAAD